MHWITKRARDGERARESGARRSNTKEGEEVIAKCMTCGCKTELEPKQLVEGARCTRCGGTFPPPHQPLKATAHDLSLITYGTRVPLLAVFTRRACVQSRAILKRLESIAERFAGRAVICVVDAEEDHAAFGTLGLTATPSFTLARAGRLLLLQDGWVEPSMIEQWLKLGARA